MLTDYQCKKCQVIVEAWKDDIIKCCTCGKVMKEKKYGSRSHGGGHDFRFRDQSTSEGS